jgi:hypothetical protein
MINTTLNQIRHQLEHLSYLQDTQDPINQLFKNLSSNERWKVKLQNDEYSGLKFTENQTKSIQLNLQEKTEEGTSQKKNFNLLHLFTNKRSPNFPTQNQKIILEKLKCIPIYTVVNNFNEVVIASPREDKPKNTMNYLRSIYNELFFWSHDEGPISILLFFMNEEDAGSYLHEICKKDPKEAEKLGLNIKKIGLDTFYKFNRTSPPKVQAKLIGDLKEIDEIIKKTKNASILNINPKQRYSKNWFQGIPVYKLKLTNGNNIKILSEYKLISKTEKSYVFFRESDLDVAWKEYITRNKGIHIQREANFEIYNLENLLLDLEKKETFNIENIILVPPYEKFREPKLNKIPIFNGEYSNQTRLMYSLKLKFEDVKRFYKGFLWLITSDTLPSEENSW